MRLSCVSLSCHFRCLICVFWSLFSKLCIYFLNAKKPVNMRACNINPHIYWLSQNHNKKSSILVSSSPHNRLVMGFFIFRVPFRVTLDEICYLYIVPIMQKLHIIIECKFTSCDIIHKLPKWISLELLPVLI